MYFHSFYDIVQCFMKFQQNINEFILLYLQTNLVL